MRILVSFALFCLFAILIGASLALGRNQPESALIQQLRLRDCVPPCWIGIVPGQTSANEVYHRFSEAFSFSRNELPIQRTDLTPFSYYDVVSFSANGDAENLPTVRLDFFDDIAGRIVINIGDDYSAIAALSIGDVINLFGPPTCVAPWTRIFSHWWFIYETSGGVAVFAVEGQSLDWTHPISILDLSRRISATEEICSRFYPWRGLHRNRYTEST